MTTATDKAKQLDETIKAKAAELATKYGVKVTPVLFKDPADESVDVIGYIKEPPRHVKIRVMDKALTSPITAASELVDAYLIRDESDKRITDESPDNEKY